MAHAVKEEEDELVQLFVQCNAALITQRYDELHQCIKKVQYKDRQTALRAFDGWDRYVASLKSGQERVSWMQYTLLMAASYEPWFWAELGRRCQPWRFVYIERYLRATFWDLMSNKTDAGPELRSPRAFAVHVAALIVTETESCGELRRRYGSKIEVMPGTAIVHPQIQASIDAAKAAAAAAAAQPTTVLPKSS